MRGRWQVRLLEHHRLEAVHEDMSGRLELQNKSQVPAAIPLAVGNYLIARSAHGLVAVDFTTGKRIWRSQPERLSKLQELIAGTKGVGDKNRQVDSAQTFARLIWEDYLFNSTSSDGERVFAIRDLTIPTYNQTRNFRFPRQQQRDQQVRMTNRLCAYDLPTEGKLVWEIDGEVRKDELQGAFFLGAPVYILL